ncbi:MAG: hypothetical protein K0S65_593 [Labilithrix sp.]|nr:hypothetical protein [Labilithrix sp.]
MLFGLPPKPRSRSVLTKVSTDSKRARTPSTRSATRRRRHGRFGTEAVVRCSLAGASSSTAGSLAAAIFPCRDGSLMPISRNRCRAGPHRFASAVARPRRHLYPGPMARRVHAWMRLARLLVACVAFFVARPAAATPALDTIVLVASAELAAGRPVDEAQASRTRTAAHWESPGRCVAPLAQPEGCPRAAGTPLVLVREKYLRNCALLC